MTPDWDDGPVAVPYSDLTYSQTLNLYAYAGNDPVTNVDPDGHDVHVCVSNGNGSQNCFDATDQQYADIRNGNNPGVVLPGGNFPTGNITCGGQVCGSARYFEAGMGDDTGTLLNLAALVEGARAIPSMVEGSVTLGRAIVEGITGILGGDEEATLPDLGNLSRKIVRQMKARGWTNDDIIETVRNGARHEVINKSTGGAAIEYVNPANGKFVVIDKATNQVLQVSGR